MTLLRHLRRQAAKFSIAVRLRALRRHARHLWERAAMAFPLLGAPRHRQLRAFFSFTDFAIMDEISEAEAPPPPPPAALSPPCSDLDDASEADALPIKVSLLGDPHIGKTTFMVKYVGDAEEHKGLQLSGLNLMNKIVVVKGARLAFSIWDVGGGQGLADHIPIACKDAMAILVMFDLTCRPTLRNAIGWYQQARKWNKTAISILIGTKFDDFVQLPRDMQWTIVNEARAYARAMNATLFFSSATHNINVSKIFKFVTAKLFNLPWTIHRNIKLGEPIIDF